MAFVYKYLDDKDQILYIGKVSGHYMFNLASRIKGHERDSWIPKGKNKTYRVYYVPNLSTSDADILETILICKYLPIGNQAKMWEKSSLEDVTDSLDWQLFDIQAPPVKPIRCKVERGSYTRCGFCGKEMRNTGDHYTLELSIQRQYLYFEGFFCRKCSLELFTASSLILNKAFKTNITTEEVSPAPSEPPPLLLKHEDGAA